MPSQVGNKWKARVTQTVYNENGRHKREHTEMCLTKKAALEWEANKRKELKEAREEKTFTGFYASYTRYLDLAKVSMVKKTYDEKRKLLVELILHLGVVLEDDDGKVAVKRDVPLDGSPHFRSRTF